ncbi:MAG: hypothetical protein HZB43_09770 [candidate division Zixibacteria bacterium]|nr:hypothetical protein [candidate division Zixibacteria bacterium]
MKSTLCWLIAIVLTLALAYFQRRTGPTHPASGKIEVAGQSIAFKLPRSHAGEGDAEISVAVSNPLITGEISYRRYKSNDEWKTLPMIWRDGNLTASLPHQPSAGKIVYQVTLSTAANKPQPLTAEPVVIRFNSGVPLGFLIPHIFLMFTSMLLSTRTGLEALTRGAAVPKMALWTVILLFLGGLILGPIVQKYAFGAFWTGWPFGNDLTDNKTVVAFAGWLVAWLRIRRHPDRRTEAIGAAAILLAVYLIPHSVLGSEIDYTQSPPVTGASAP